MELDRFGEAFGRFEQDVDVSKIKSFRQLLTAFSWWAGNRFIGSKLQIEALKVEAERLGIPAPRPIYVQRPTYRIEYLIRRGRQVSVNRDIKTGRFIKV